MHFPVKITKYCQFISYICVTWYFYIVQGPKYQYFLKTIKIDNFKEDIASNRFQIKCLPKNEKKV